MKNKLTKIEEIGNLMSDLNKAEFKLNRIEEIHEKELKEIEEEIEKNIEFIDGAGFVTREQLKQIFVKHKEQKGEENDRI